MASTALLILEDKSAAAAQQEEQRQHLKCPRCDSSNTKFCYYNNYSLSQPRHFCKSCKRYWTRGGTLRNVPVGGGCRKNKRLRPPSSSSFDTTTTTTPPSSSAQIVDVAPAPNSPSVLLTPAAQIDLNPPIFYGLPTTAPEFPFSAGYHDHELNHVGGVSTLGFSSAATPTIASLLASTFQYHSHNKTTPSRLGSFQELSTPPPSYNDHQQDQASRDDSSDMNHVKVEEGQQWSNYIMSGCQNPMEQQVGLSDPFVFWNMSNTAAGTTVGAASQFGLL